MHAFVFATSAGPQGIPQALLPMKGRPVLDYLLDDICDQKDVTKITVITTTTLMPIIKKHLQNAYGTNNIMVTAEKTIDDESDALICQGVLYSSLKMQDLIRAFKQHKTAITAEYQKDGQRIHIPHCIIPKHELPTYGPHIGENRLAAEWMHGMRIQNMGTGFCYEASSLL